MEEPQSSYVDAELENLQLEPNEKLDRYKELAYMDVIDPRIWQGQASVNWRHRESAAQSVLNYVGNEA